MRSLKNNSGFGLVETLVGVFVFVLIGTAAYGGFVRVLSGVQVLKAKNLATSLANEQIEIAKNLPYVDVGIVNGIPDGKIPRDQQLLRGGITFDVNTSVRDIDDPFDGTIGGSPNDLSPADYKLVEITISCEDCRLESELKYYARVAPLALETTGNNGALFVQVIDAEGQPFSGADVHIENNQGTSTIVIDETTNNDGFFQIVDAPTGTEAYEITVSNGSNYSTDRTYTVGEPSNPAPNKPHANVVTGSVTQITFAIDELSDIDIYTRKNTCERVANVDFNLKGSKTVGLDVYKHDIDTQTNSLGFVDIDDIEWDSYEFTITDTGWDLAGSSIPLPIEVNVGAQHEIDLILENKEPNALLLKVLDAQTGLPVSGADVTLDDGADSTTLVTGRGFLFQTDWSGGSGQENFIDNDTKYYSSFNIENVTTPGRIELTQFGGSYNTSGDLESSTFDTGTTTNFGSIFWNPVDQPPQTGSDAVRFQLASNLIVHATTTWDFVGPDGTSGSYYTSPGEVIHSSHHGDRYYRYKTYLQTADDNFTPIISNTSVTFTSECAPPGQVFFTNLDSGTSTLTVDHPSYQQFQDVNFTITEAWDDYDVTLTP